MHLKDEKERLSVLNRPKIDLSWCVLGLEYLLHCTVIADSVKLKLNHIGLPSIDASAQNFQKYVQRSFRSIQ